MKINYRIISYPVFGSKINTIYSFAEFIDNQKKIVDIEPGGLGMQIGYHASPLDHRGKGIIHNYGTYIVLNKNNEIILSYSIASDLNYPDIGPEYSYMRDTGLAKYTSKIDAEAL